MSHVIKILIADEHPVVAAGLRSTLAREGVAFLKPATTRDEVLRKATAEKPDVIILDILFDGDVQTSLVRDCRRRAPEATIVVFTSLVARSHRRLVLDAGADAYLEKSRSLEELAAYLTPLLGSRLNGGADRTALDAAASASARLPSEADPILIRPPAREQGAAAGEIDLPHLTAREREVAHLLSTGRPIAEIAAFLGVGAKTAAVHRDNLRKKMQCRDTNELIARLARIYATTT